MLEDSVWDVGDMPPLIRNGMDMKFNAAKALIEDYCKRTGRQLVKIKLAPGEDRIEPMYFFQGDESGYTKRDLETNIQRMRQNTDTTVINLN